MPTNRLVGSKVCEFRPDDGGAPIALHGNMQTVTDTLRTRLAVHEFLKVDGALVEVMGKSPNNYKLLLHYVGPNWRRDYQNLAARLDKTPKGVLIHPVFGELRVACQGIEGGAVDVAQAVDAITVPISFIDDSVDTNVQSDTSVSVSQKKSTLDDAIKAFTDAAAPYAAPFGETFGGVSIATLIAAVATTATTYGEAASAASDGNESDPALQTQLEAVGASCDLSIGAIEASAVNDGNADAYDAVAAAMQVYASALELKASIDAARPPVVTYTVGSDTNILALASILYGSQAAARIDEILLLNPNLDAYNIRAGTQLRLTTPTLV